MRTRVAVAALGFALTVVLSYTAQRLVSWWGGEPAFSEIVSSVHIPYYWRTSVSVLHGVMVALLVGFGADEAQALRVLRWGPQLVLGLVLPCAVALVVVP